MFKACPLVTHLRTAIAVVVLLLSPAVVFAQASITGVARDLSGAVLPGVTVEASSPALIEKVRVGTTDGSGQYRIVDLRPGVYSITFTLPGFNTFRRDGLELTGSFIATVNAEMRVGGVEETVTVTSESPVVDVQSSTKQRVLTAEVIEAIPSGRSQYNLGALIPGALVSGGQDVGGSAGLDAAFAMTIHGSTADSQRITQNGITLGTIVGGGYGGGAVPNASAVQEWTFDYSGVSAEMATGGVRINFIPKEGGNRVSGVVFGSFTNSSLQGDNFSQDLRERGLLYPNLMKRIWDFNPGLGGPIARDRVWFYASVRSNGSWNYVPGMVYNRNANNPAAWTYDPDPSAPVSNDNTWREAQFRLTSQVTSRHKVAVTFDQQHLCECPNGVNSTTAPEAGRERRFPRQRSVQGDWTFPATTRLLIDGGVMHRFEGWAHNPSFTNRPSDRIDGLNPAMISVTELAGSIPGLVYRAAPTYSDGDNWALYYRVAASYVTGAHSFKVGFNNGTGRTNTRTYNYQPVSYVFRDGVPQQLTQWATPYSSSVNLDNDLGIYVQDRWTRGRLTLNLGLRYDFTNTSTPEQTLGHGALVPNRSATLSPQSGLSWHDVTPKTGLAYDVFGTGNTAVKLVFSKYLQGQLTGLASQLNPVSTLVTSATRTWSDTNGNFVPDCDLLSTAANGECLALSNTNFGTVVPGSTFDPDLIRGWGKRNYNWEFSASVQQRLLPRTSLEVGYFRRWYGNFPVTDNRTLSAADFDTFSITAPLDPRLPDGGGQTIGPLYNVVPGKFTLPADNFVTLSNAYGRQIQHWNGVDVNVDARLRGGVVVQGGTSTGRTSTDNCEIVAQVPEVSLLGAPYCHQDTHWLTQVKLLSTYQLPKVGILVSGTFQSVPGTTLNANYNVPFSVYGPSLGRVISGGNANSTIQVNAVQPGTEFTDRINQVDLRIGRMFRTGRVRSTLNLDLYNALNVNPVVAVNNTYNAAAVVNPSSAWRAPQSILTARFVKFSVNVAF